MPNSQAIDVHTHILPARAIEAIRGDDSLGIEISADMIWRGGPHPTSRIRPELVEPLPKLAELDRMGLAGCVVSPFVGLLHYRLEAAPAGRLFSATNEGLAEFCAARPDRLWWMADLPIQHPSLALTLLAEAATAGCVGVELAAQIAGRMLDDPAFSPIWAALEERDLAVFIHSASDSAPPPPSFDSFHLVNVIGNPLQTTVAAERLICSGILDRHPGLRVVLAHGGGFFPYQAGRLRHALQVRPEMAGIAGDPWSYAGRLLFDTITHDPQALAYLVLRAGVDNVVLGTDMPFDMGTTTPIADVSEAVDERASQAICEVNPRRVFGLPQAPEVALRR
ncbi:MAG TPA: amidohydrolase family protein [Candidatus Nitrosotalea sp.]|nr:amidohydrolase family protein [Candidatus Nitrosotalea sp.]